MTGGALLLFPHLTFSAADEFKSLFNGRDLTGWVNVGTKEGAWKVEGGNLVVDRAEGGWLRTDREYKNFVIRLDFKLSPSGNSGVFLRAPIQGNSAYEGLEIQILDHFHPDYHKPGAEIRPEQYTGSVYDLVAASDTKVLKPVGEWNSYEITHDGDHIVVVLNGKKIVDTDLSKLHSHIDKHPGLGRKQGYVGLQAHNGRIEFRNLAIRELK